MYRQEYMLVSLHFTNYLLEGYRLAHIALALSNSELYLLDGALGLCAHLCFTAHATQVIKSKKKKPNSLT